MRHKKDLYDIRCMHYREFSWARDYLDLSHCHRKRSGEIHGCRLTIKYNGWSRSGRTDLFFDIVTDTILDSGPGLT